ncbi:hypothetical protein BDB01DRAFT_834796 [Pilobolus umbonatus]|nr:hypothetical protein BDB01DRAFT_834796 [Pilobolus umbonatus]
MSNTSCLLRLGTDHMENTSVIIHFVLEQLQLKYNTIQEGIQQYGKGIEVVTRPWALIVCKDMAIHKENTNIQPEQRIWLDYIRICHIDTIHQLRALLSGVHMVPDIMNNKENSSNILSWIAHEKDGQPPVIIVVVDLVDLLISNMNKDYNIHDPLRYLTLRLDELGQMVATLKETCNYMSTSLKGQWEKALQIPLVYHTDLLITDTCIPDKDGSQLIQGIYNIFNYYFDSIL